VPHGYVFAAPGTISLRGSSGVLITREDYKGVFSITGPVEQEGRLRYIDGCTDSLLIPPVMFGDPCLNLLYFPPGINQTAHTHPSDRVGMILSGEGVCHAWNDGVEDRINLTPGVIFCIHAGGKHKFSTDNRHLRVLAYHPESDFGPQHDEHPMLNRTIVDGVSARELPGIQTKAPD
jgi:mannose-6-phosphate isomerase-like protein (cupin superfamily)